jgi:hypothetical protein
LDTKNSGGVRPLSHLSRPESTYCFVCGAMIFEDEPTYCDECGVQFSFKLNCCLGFTVLFPADVLEDTDLSCPDCGKSFAVSDLIVIDTNLLLQSERK